jgi:serine/threonine protein kinase
MSGNLSGVSQPQHRGGTLRASDALQAAICSGASFGIYVVREVIGVGKTSSIYRAHDTRLLREVAIKVLNTGALAGADGLARFLHEARMAAAIRHPNVVSIFDVGVHDGSPYIVMELLTGVDLDVRLNAARVLREPALIDMGLRLAFGLAAVHDAGVVHRDLRPSNVFLTHDPDGSTQPKLLDFGVSKQARDNLRLTTNGRRRWASMPLYTAPEVLRDGQATFLSDQYSLGVLLYECVTGVHPFRADSFRDSVELITAGQARRIADQPIRPSRRLGAIIERAMHLDPERRFADLRELGHALAAASGRRAIWPWNSSPEPSVARAPSPNPGARSRPAPRDRASGSERGLSWAIGATVIGCSIGAPLLAWYSAHQHRATAPLSVASPLSPAEGHAAVVVPPPSAACAAPCPAPSDVHAAPLVLGNQAPASSAAAHALAPALAAAPPPEQALPRAQEQAPLAATDFAERPEGGEAAPRGQAAQPALPVAAVPKSGQLDSGVSTQADGGVPETRDSLDVPLPSVTIAPSGPARGTNGALIFD